MVGWGVEQGIILAIVLSILAHLRHSYNPHTTTSEPKPGLVVCRWGAGLYFANASKFAEQVSALAADAKCVAVDCVAVGDIDYTGGETIIQVAEQLKKHDVRLVLAGLDPSVRAELDAAGVTASIGEAALFDTVDDAVAAYGER